MSLFSYISFPREIDRSCLISHFDNSKSFLLNEIRGTELEKQYLSILVKNITTNIIPPVPIEQLYSLLEENIKHQPDDTWIYLGDSIESTDLYSGISINSTSQIMPDNIFTNRFIYDLLASFKIDKQNVYFESCNNINEEDKNNWYYTEKTMIDRAIYHRKQLYDIVKSNIKFNEFVEIYSIYVHQINGEDIFNFDLPTEIRQINVEEILTSKLLDFDSNLKTIIYRNK